LGPEHNNQIKRQLGPRWNEGNGFIEVHGTGLIHERKGKIQIISGLSL